MNVVIWLVKNISRYAWLHLIDISGISIKRHFKLIYHFEVLWAYPAAPGPIDFFMDVYPHQKINFMLQLFHEILDFQEPCILIGQEYLWQ